MLNRLYIVVGMLAILLLAAAFIVPAFIPWSQFRHNLEAIAGEALGTEVRITGDIAFTLLPQPRLTFDTVSAGPQAAPNLSVAAVEAEFSLVDFLRDRYVITRLRLDRPAVTIRVAADGTVDTGLAIARQVSATKVSVASAVIADGVVELVDARAGETHTVRQVAGELKLEALRGPFTFQGGGIVEGSAYTLRLTTGTLDDTGRASVAASLRSEAGRYSVSVEGELRSGTLPAFSGTITYRQPPAQSQDGGRVDVGRGDMVMTGKVEAGPAKILLSDYLVVPDENRAATRLQGAAEISLGRDMAFNAVISGGVLALPPRDATADQAAAPYELIRLLGDLPLPAAPGVPGTVGLDISELDLGTASLRNVRLDASAHSAGWTVRQFSGLLGGAELRLAGEVATPSGKPEFSGTLRLATGRLDTLAALWREPDAANPLFNMSGAIEANVDLVGETLSLSQGRLTLDGETRTFSAQIGLGGVHDLHLTADLGQLDTARSRSLLALLPNPAGDPAFMASFPKGHFNLVADTLTLGDLPGRALRAEGSWDGGVLVLDTLSAGDLGGASFSLAATAFGTFARPELSGTGSLKVAGADAPALAVFYNAIGASPMVVDFLSRWAPADLAFRLDAPTGEGAQELAISGLLGASEITADATLERGFFRALAGRIRLELQLLSAAPAALTAQLGLGEVALLSDVGPMRLVGRIDGNVANSLETILRAEAGGDHLAFAGHVVVTGEDGVSGKGTVEAKLADASAIIDRIGAGGLGLPPLNGGAALEFSGLRSIRLETIAGLSGGQAFSGELAYDAVGPLPTITGRLAVGRLDVDGLLKTLVGPAALLDGAGTLWPDGPLATGNAPRQTTGRIRVSAPSIWGGQRELATGAGFDLAWDATNIRLRDFSAIAGGGTVALEVAICCSGPLPSKRVWGRGVLDGVALDALLPPALADALSGTIEAGGTFDGTGGSLDELMSLMTGEGTFKLAELVIERFDPDALVTIASLESLLEMQPEQLAARIESGLDDGAFRGASAAGSFTIAGGVLRSPNLAIEGSTGRIFGSGTLRLADLGIGGEYALSAAPPPAPPDERLPTELAGAQVTARLSGSLAEPQRSLDVSRLVDAIMVRAYEREVLRLEELRARDEARRAAEEAEKARLAAEEEAARQAAAAAEQAAAEATARQAAEAEARRAAEAEAARRAAARKRAEEEANRPMDLGLGN